MPISQRAQHAADQRGEDEERCEASCKEAAKIASAGAQQGLQHDHKDGERNQDKHDV